MGRLIDFSDIDNEVLDCISHMHTSVLIEKAEMGSFVNKLETLYNIIQANDFPKNLYNEETRNTFREVANYLVTIHEHIPRIDYNL